MKNLIKNSILSLATGVLLFSAGCEDKKWSENYDINWPVPEVKTLSQTGDVAIGSELTITGTNFANVTVEVNGVECDILSVNDAETEIKVNLPRIFEAGQVQVYNVYRRFGASNDILTPVYPDVIVTKVHDIPAGLTFPIEGENVDIITSVYINSVAVPVVSREPEKIIANAAGLELSPGQLVTVSFKSLAPNTIPSVPNVNVVYPFIEYKELAIWDFEDGAHVYVGEGTATVVSGGSDAPGNLDKYFQLRAPGYGWDKATGEMVSNEVPDITTFVNPYLTFCVRTPVGSAGYFQMEDQQGNWRHFDYGFNTGGEWMIVSQPLSAKWEPNNDNFDARKFKPKLGFKAGNAGTKQDLDIAYVKITEGEYDGAIQPGDPIGSDPRPAVIQLMSFEDTQNWPDQVNADNGKLIAALDNKARPAADQISAFNGSHFYTYGDDGTLGNWSGYWGNTISADASSHNLKVFNDAYLSLALNPGFGKGQQYVIARIYQYDGQLVMVKKFFPNQGGLWSTFQFSLFNEDLENWSDDSTDLGKHYKSLKRLNPDVPVERIELIVSRNDANEVVISIDELAITEGPRY